MSKNNATSAIPRCSMHDLLASLCRHAAQLTHHFSAVAELLV